MITLAPTQPARTSDQSAIYSLGTNDSPEYQELIFARISHALQISLDISQILALFFNRTQALVPVKGMRYINSLQQLDLSFGEQSLHRCHYRLLTDQGILGTLVFTRRTPFTESEMALLEQITGCVIYPLRNGLQYREALKTAMSDPLTGIGNRSAFESSIHREIQLADRYQQSLSLLIMDIDHFKYINDTYGHISGDQVLRETALAMQRTVRETDQVFRYGGEEFVVVLSNTSGEAAEEIAERIRQSIEQLSVTIKSHRIKLTVSIGGCSLTGKDVNLLDNEKMETGIRHLTQNQSVPKQPLHLLNQSAHEKPTKKAAARLFEQADACLYTAKHSGRNCVVFHHLDSHELSPHFS